MPSASSGVRPLGNLAEDRDNGVPGTRPEPRTEPRSGGPQVEHGEDPPVDAFL